MYYCVLCGFAMHPYWLCERCGGWGWMLIDPEFLVTPAYKRWSDQRRKEN